MRCELTAINDLQRIFWGFFIDSTIMAVTSVSNIFCVFLLQPVMIFIHGGSFVDGSSNLYPSDMLVATQDVVVVTINYRLNAFGFLSSRDSTLPGNYGMWDQIMSIQWVKDNIADYGGNPDQITLFGESAGAFAITYHIISPVNNVSLFQRVITESGSVFSRAFLASDPSTSFSSVLDSVGCQYDNLISCLRSKPFEQLLNATQSPNRALEFFPILDNDFLPKDLANQLAKFTKASYPDSFNINMADFPKYDVFSGWNDQEGLLYINTLNALSLELEGRNISNGVSEPVLYAAISSKLAETVADKAAVQLLTNLLMNYYINTPYHMNSDGRSADDRRLETYVNIAGRG